jgi:hypothetical protein
MLLFNLDQKSNICLEISKRLNIEYDKKMFTTSTENISNNQKAKTPEEVEKYFPGFIAFTDYIEQQIPRPANKRRRKALFRQEEKSCFVA